MTDMEIINRVCETAETIYNMHLEDLSKDMGIEKRNAFIKTAKCINSCFKWEHLITASNMLIAYQNTYGFSEYLKRQYFIKSNDLKSTCQI